MKRVLKRLFLCLILAVLLWTIGIISDRRQLNTGLIRFHVVANSDDAADQNIKLKVRDAVMNSMQADLRNITDMEAAKEYLRENLPKIETVANDTLQAIGVDQKVVVTLCREAFDIRNYDTFTLPSGVYDSLRIIIGRGEGQNWWCVAFPTLCMPATTEDFASVAADAGLSASLVNTLSGDKTSQIRFFFLDCLGRMEMSRITDK